MYLKTPLVVVGSSEEAMPAPMGAPLPNILLPDLKNYAKNEGVIETINDYLLPIIKSTKNDRIPLEQEWDAIRRMEMQEHDEGRSYIGRSNAYLPLYNKALSTRVSAVSTGLFPGDEYMDVSTRRTDLISRARAKAVKTYIQWEFERVAHLQQVLKTGLRSLENFGIAVYKAWYEKRIARQGRVAAERSMLGGMMATPSFQPRTLCEGLQVSARPAHNVYFYPTTASSLDECSVVFEILRVPRSKVEELIRNKRIENGDLALEHNGDIDDSIDTQSMDSADMGSTDDKRNFCTLTEVWCYMQLPRDAYMMDEDYEEPIPCRILLAGNNILSVTRNPFWHQKPPYLVARTNIQPGFFYGYGVGRIVRDIQYLANDFANQTNDCGNYCLNPINKIDPGSIAGPLTPLRPGATWYFTDIAKGQAFDRPPTDLIGAGQNMLNMYISMLADYSGAPPVLQGAGARGAAKTATGAQILQRNAMSPLQDTVEDFERDVLEPLMWMTWMNAQQYREEPVFVEVAGQSLRFDPTMLDIDPEFIWTASSKAASQQQRASQQMQLIQILGSLAPLLQAQGKMVDFAYLVTRLASDGLGFRGMEQVIKDMPMPMMGPGGPMPGGPPAPEGEEPRSAMPGVPEGAPIEEGEGDDFGGVRQNADEMSAMLGMMNGGV